MEDLQKENSQQENSQQENSASQRFGEAVAIMARLRGPEGCPWDREQSFDSIRKYTLEEVYEVFDAIERRDWLHLQEELGDLLLQVLFYAQMAAESGYFTIADVVDGLNGKLIRRHPHVFDGGAMMPSENSSAALPGADLTEGAAGLNEGIDMSRIDTARVLRNWEAIKSEEKKAAQQSDTDPEGESRLASVPRSMPALMEARKLGSRAARSGFDWRDADGLFAKLEEEAGELREAIAGKHPGGGVEDEVGDLLFTVVNLARHLNIDPEMALRATSARFRSRFAAMEEAGSAGRPLEELSAAELEELWSLAKKQERTATQVSELNPGSESE